MLCAGLVSGQSQRFVLVMWQTIAQWDRRECGLWQPDEADAKPCRLQPPSLPLTPCRVDEQLTELGLCQPSVGPDVLFPNFQFTKMIAIDYLQPKADQLIKASNRKKNTGHDNIYSETERFQQYLPRPTTLFTFCWFWESFCLGEYLFFPSTYCWQKLKAQAWNILPTSLSPDLLSLTLFSSPSSSPVLQEWNSNGGFNFLCARKWDCLAG